eukprot:GILI01042327.1.p1 GENE.GILI01042327.1~~GILI01042327.1.p1  ORF type:complete len:628 (+),score=84.03 GILI01042327.1:103-1884(+)
MAKSQRSKRLACINGSAQLVDWDANQLPTASGETSTTTSADNSKEVPRPYPPYFMGCDVGADVGASAQLISRVCLDYAQLLGGGGDSSAPLSPAEGLSRCTTSIYQDAAGRSIPLKAGQTRYSVMRYASGTHTSAANYLGHSAASNKFGRIKVTTRSEIRKAQRHTIYPSSYIPSNVPLLSDAAPHPVIHVMYLHEKRFESNLGHSLYRVIDMLRTAKGVRRALGSSTDPTVPPYKVVALLTLEATGRTMGPFMVPLLRGSSLFDNVIVAPDDGQRYRQEEVRMESEAGCEDALNVTLEPSTHVTSALPTKPHLHEEFEMARTSIMPTSTRRPFTEGPRATFVFPPSEGRQNITASSLLTTRPLLCYDNIVTSSRGSPQFAQASHGDAFLVSTISEFRSDLASHWKLKQLCGDGEAGGGTIRITFINRRASRRILNMDELKKSVHDALHETHCPNSKGDMCQYRFTFAVVELEYFTHSLAAQAASFYCSDIVVAVHGAAVAWLVAMRPGTSLIELLPYNWQLISDQGTTPLYQAIIDGTAVSHSELWLGNFNGGGSAQAKKRAFSDNFALQEQDVRRVWHAVGKEVKRLLGQG